MTALFITASLLLIFLVLDRVQGIISRRRSFIDEEKKSKLEVLKIVAKEELHQTGDPQSKEQWITRLLRMMGFDEIASHRPVEESGYNFTCLDQKGRRVYVVCKLWNIAEFEAPVSLAAVQNLVGAMVAGRVRHGLIITAGELTDEAKNYIRQLPVTYRIKVIEGESLMEQLYDWRKVNLKPLLDS